MKTYYVVFVADHSESLVVGATTDLAIAEARVAYILKNGYRQTFSDGDHYVYENAYFETVLELADVRK